MHYELWSSYKGTVYESMLKKNVWAKEILTDWVYKKTCLLGCHSTNQTIKLWKELGFYHEYPYKKNTYLSIKRRSEIAQGLYKFQEETK